MKMDLPSEQARIYELLGGFVRVDRSDEALWISDLPRRMENVQDLGKKLLEAGFACRLDGKTRLWYIDWTERRWEEMLAPYPHALPPLPAADRLHPVYALCRLWMLHPSDRTPENLPMVRRVLKLMNEPEEKLLASVAAMHAQAAANLRSGIPSAYDAGRLLAGWLRERRSET